MPCVEPRGQQMRRREFITQSARQRYLDNLKRRASFRGIIAAMNKGSRTRRAWWHLLAGFLFALSVHTPAAPEDAPPISTMLKEGWQIAGYSQAFDNRSTFILFRHSDHAYLVQCRVGYAVPRNTRTCSMCYMLERVRSFRVAHLGKQRTSPPLQADKLRQYDVRSWTGRAGNETTRFPRGGGQCSDMAAYSTRTAT